jgi:2-haloacid dehalogenase
MSELHIQAVLFDVFGTVVDWRTSVAAAWERFAEECGISQHGQGLDPHAFADQWRAKYRPSIASIRSGEREFTPLDQLHLENLLEVLVDNGIDSSRWPPAALTQLNDAWRRLDPWPDSVAGLQMLKRRYVVGALSNGTLSMLTKLGRYARLPWDAIIGSDVVQAYKPDPSAYERAARLLDLAPSSIMLCAAHNYDLEAAGAVGFRTAFLRRPTEYGVDQRSDLEPTGSWDVLADSIPELARLLPAGPARAPAPECRTVEA